MNFIRLQHCLDGGGCKTSIVFISILSYIFMENLTEYKELKKVEEDIKKLKTRRLEILRKKETDRDDAEKAELTDYNSNLAKLEADKKYWQNAITVAQSHQRGIFMHVNIRPK